MDIKSPSDDDFVDNDITLATCASCHAVHSQTELVEHAGNTLATICHTAAATAGWWNTSRGDVRNWPDDLIKLWVGTKLALVHSEVSEGLEGYRKNKMDDHLPHRPMLEVELADAIIRIMDLAGGLGMDIGGAIAEKLQYNAKRLDHKPEHRNAAGGKTF